MECGRSAQKRVGGECRQSLTLPDVADSQYKAGPVARWSQVGGCIISSFSGLHCDFVAQQDPNLCNNVSDTNAHFFWLIGKAYHMFFGSKLAVYTEVRMPSGPSRHIA